jgi:ribosomal protein S18 acetylase RimI-like enzyme
VDIEIRRIRSDEGEQLREVRLRALQDAPGAFSSTFDESRQRPAREWADRARTQSSSHHEATFVAEMPGNGYRFLGLARGAHLDGRPGSVELTSMWVDPGCRGAGLGDGLVQAVVDWARAGGARQVELWVVEDNDPAMALYRRGGFVTTSDRQPFPNRPDLEELRMALSFDHG